MTAHRLKRCLRNHLRIQASLKHGQIHLGAQLAILRQRAPGLAHKPHRGAGGALPIKCSQEGGLGRVGWRQSIHRLLILAIDNLNNIHVFKYRISGSYAYLTAFMTPRLYLFKMTLRHLKNLAVAGKTDALELTVVVA